MSQTTFFNSICGKSETASKAAQIYSVAQLKTRRGGGFHVATINAGLPAICALLASESLGNGDVNQETAQRASSLKKTDFLKCYNLVQTVLASSSSPQSSSTKREGSRSSSNKIYQSLIGPGHLNVSYKQWMVWIAAAETKLSLLGQREVDEPLDTTSLEVKICIFAWICHALGHTEPSIQSLSETHEVQMESLQAIYDLLERHCLQVKNQIKSPDPIALPMITTPRKKSISPSKRPTRELLTKDSPSPSKKKTQTPVNPELESEPEPEPGSSTSSPFKSPTKSSNPIPNLTDLSLQTPTRKRVPSAKMREVLMKPSPVETKKRKAPPIDPDTVPASDEEDADVDDEDDDVLKLPITALSLSSPSPSKRPKVTYERLQTRVTQGEPAQPITPSKLRQSVTFSTPTKPTKRNENLFTGSELSHSGEEDEETTQDKTISRRRFRPVYLSLSQWNSLDPLVQNFQSILREGTKREATKGKEAGKSDEISNICKKLIEEYMSID